MPERTLALPLAGNEIIELFVDKFRAALQRNGHLNPALAYDHFEGKVSISTVVHDLGRKVEVEETAKLTLGEPPEDENAFLEQAESEFNVENQAPNEARVESGQPVPVLSKDVDGRPEIKKVRYSRKEKGKSA